MEKKKRVGGRCEVFVDVRGSQKRCVRIVILE
jgi:hypothetical protein